MSLDIVDGKTTARGAFTVNLPTKRPSISGQYGLVGFIWRRLGVLDFRLKMFCAFPVLSDIL